MSYLKLWQTGRNKYHAKKTMVNGKKYDSMKEASVAMRLTSMVKSGEIAGFEPHYKVELFGERGSKVATYKVDFKIDHTDGTTEFLEVKSPVTMTSVWRIKWKLMEDKFGRDHQYKLTVEK